MKQVLIIILLMLRLVIPASAQEQPTKRQQADRLFERGEYFKSLGLYLGLADKDDAGIVVIEHVADCYRLVNDYRDAEPWYQKAIAYPGADIMDTYYYAEILLRNKKLEEARKQYEIYYTKINDTTGLAFKLATCDSAAAWMKHPANFTVKNEKQFNSPYSDWGLDYYGKTGFIFTSDRKGDDDRGTQGTYNRTGNGYFKLYQVIDGKINLLPLDIKRGKVFNGDYHIGPVVLNNALDTAYITVTTTIPKKVLPVVKAGGSAQRVYTRRLQLIVAAKVNGIWGNFKSFPYNNVKEYSVGLAALSNDGNVIYFTSDMPGGEGKTDIWYCVKQADGSWGKPVNCGKTINTTEDEAFPVINNNVLYYSSKGLPGMGGYDIFKAKGERSDWGKPENLKYPVNSTSDDFYYITHNGVSGYFASNREGGEGDDDIYSFNDMGPVIIKNPPKTLQPGILPSSPIKNETPVILGIIYYDLDKSYIRPDAAAGLDKLVLILKEHPGMRIELSSYTDSRASGAYNMALSKRRSASAIAYLVKKGISAERLVAHYYGKLDPVNKCAAGVPCTEAEYQLNRRTVFKQLNQ